MELINPFDNGVLRPRFELNCGTFILNRGQKKCLSGFLSVEFNRLSNNLKPDHSLHITHSHYIL